MVLLCKYVFFFPTSSKPTMEYLPLVKSLALGWPYALGTMLLASVCQTISKYVIDEPYYKVGGTLFFIFLFFCIFS